MESKKEKEKEKPCDKDKKEEKNLKSRFGLEDDDITSMTHNPIFEDFLDLASLDEHFLDDFDLLDDEDSLGLLLNHHNEEGELQMRNFNSV